LKSPENTRENTFGISPISTNQMGIRNIDQYLNETSNAYVVQHPGIIFNKYLSIDEFLTLKSVKQCFFSVPESVKQTRPRSVESFLIKSKFHLK